ncbi:MAG TPA: SPOR domain-containing protein, partial [Rhodothermales bacterium]|nr:SPOR domain-containing protein [Rhodothermales bacterium]
LYDETIGDPMDTASFSAPIVYAGEARPVASETEWKPLDNLPPAISPQAATEENPLLVLPPIEATPAIDDALMSVGNELPDDLRSPVLESPESSDLVNTTEPLMILESVRSENATEGNPISDLVSLDHTEALEALTAHEVVPVLAQPIPIAPKDPIAPPTDPKQEIAMMLEQDEPAFTVAVRYLETYRQDPTGESGADALFWAAENYQKAGLPGKARGLFQDFVRQFPDHPKVSKAQEYLQWIDVDTPSEEQVTRPTLNSALAAIPNEPKQPEGVAQSYGTPLPSFRPIGDQTPDISTPAPVSQPVSNEPYHYIAPPVMGPAMRNPPAQPIPQTVRMSSTTPEQKPHEPVSNESSKATIATATATSVPLLLRAKNFVQSKPPKVRGLIYILSGLALFLIALVLFTLSRGLFSSTTGPTISQSGQTGLTNESLVQQPGTSPTPAPGTAGGLIGSGDATTTTGGTGATAGGGGTTGSTTDLFRSPMEVQGGSDLNTSAGGWGWSLKFSSNRAELEKMAANLRSRGYRTGIITISSPQQGYRLILGQFKSKEEAKASKGKLPYDTPKDAWTVEIK